MKLYYIPGVCSLASHIALQETGANFELVAVERGTKKTSDGSDYSTINPNGYVPALVLEDGKVLNEGVAILQYIAHQKPEANLTPKLGSFEYFKQLEWLNFITSEVHKNFSPLFNKVNDEADAAARKKLDTRLAYLATVLKGKHYLMGEQFTLADAYLFTTLRWAVNAKVDLPAELVAYRDRVATRPAVQRALEAEGLLKKAAA